MPSFRPSLVVNVELKFDEQLHLQPAVRPQTTQEAIEKPAVRVNPDPVPLILRRGAENVSFIAGRIPVSASMEFPGYRQAGQFSCEFDFRDLPIDPRTVRAAAVDIHLGTVSDADFADGMSTTPSGTRRSVLRTSEETLRFVGLVDEWGVSHGASGSRVSMRGRDLRGALLDTPIGVLPGAQAQLLEELDWGRPINEVVQAILNFNPFFQDIATHTNAIEWPNGVIPAPGNPGIVPRHRRGARGERTGGRGTPNADSGSLNFWDLIVRACYLVGAIPYFQGRNLLIRPSRSIFDQQNAGTALNPTPFAGGQPRSRDEQAGVELTPPLRVRRFVYGRDVEEFSFDRKYGGYARPRVVRCVSVDSSSTDRGANRIVQGRWPPESAPEGTRRTRVAAGRQTAQEEILNIPVAGVRDTERLAEIARSIYEEIGRGEMGGMVSTKNLTSFGGTNQDPDLLRLNPGDGIEFFVDARALSSGAPLVSTLTDFTRASFEEAVRMVTERLGATRGNENLARVIVATARGQVAELQRFFRVSTVKYMWNAGTGIKIDFDFQNYVVARNQVRASTDVAGEAPWWERGEAAPDDTVTSVASAQRPALDPDAPVRIVEGES